MQKIYLNQWLDQQEAFQTFQAEYFPDLADLLSSFLLEMVALVPVKSPYVEENLAVEERVCLLLLSLKQRSFLNSQIK